MDINGFFSGSLDFLEKPAVAFVRLKQAVALESALEDAVPVCFVFVLIGPEKSDMDYHEIRRAMAALMADKVRNFSTPYLSANICRLPGNLPAKVALSRISYRINNVLTYLNLFSCPCCFFISSSSSCSGEF